MSEYCTCEQPIINIDSCSGNYNNCYTCGKRDRNKKEYDTITQENSFVYVCSKCHLHDCKCINKYSWCIPESPNINIFKFKAPKIPFKKLDPKAKIPVRNKPSDAGLDLFALEDQVVPSLFSYFWGLAALLIYKYIGQWFPSDIRDQKFGPFQEMVATKVKTGVAVQLPTGTVGLIQDRSSCGSKLLKVFGGVIDESYRGDITVCLANFSFKDYQIRAGDKIAQLVIIPCYQNESEEVQELNETERANSAFGSSGR